MSGLPDVDIFTTKRWLWLVAFIKVHTNIRFQCDGIVIIEVYDHKGKYNKKRKKIYNHIMVNQHNSCFLMGYIFFAFSM
jgi:hypothetical protein